MKENWVIYIKYKNGNTLKVTRNVKAPERTKEYRNFKKQFDTSDDIEGFGYLRESNKWGWSYLDR